VTQLTSGEWSIGEPKVSPDGNKVVFLGKGTAPGEVVLRLLRLSSGGESGSVVDLVGGITESVGQMAWSNDSTRVVYFRNAPDGRPALVIVDLGPSLTSVDPALGASTQPTAVTIRGENIQGPDAGLSVWAIRDPLGPATEGRLLEHSDTRTLRVLLPTERMGPGIFRLLVVNPTGVWGELRGFVVQGVPVPALSFAGIVAATTTAFGALARTVGRSRRRGVGHLLGA
jgi:hypothetical protein